MAPGMGGGRALPKFGEWDGKNGAAAHGFTAIFEKARDDMKTGAPHTRPTTTPTSNINNTSNAAKSNKDGPCSIPTPSKKKHWFCW